MTFECYLYFFIGCGRLALNSELKVFSLVSYAWTGFSTVFSPVVIELLYKPEIKAKSVFSV